MSVVILSFMCFIALLCSFFIEGHINIACDPFFSVTYSYTHAVALLSLIIILVVVVVKVLRKIVLVPFGWYENYKNKKEKQTIAKVMQSYLGHIGMNSHLGEFTEQYDRVLHNNQLYWLMRVQFTEGRRIAIEQLQRYENGDFIKLFYDVKLFQAKKQYENAYMLLNSANDFAYKMPWTWISMFSCALSLKKFEKCDYSLKMLKSFGESTVDVVKMEMELLIEKTKQGIDIDRNMDRMYSIIFNMDKVPEAYMDIVHQYVALLISEHDTDKTEKIIKHLWKNNPSIELGKMCDALFVGLGSAEKFAHLSKLAELNPDHIASQVLLAKSALDAGLFLIARDKLMHLAEIEPLTAFPLLAQLEKLEKNDLVASNKWLEKALQL